MINRQLSLACVLLAVISSASADDRDDGSTCGQGKVVASLQADINSIIQKLYPLFNNNILFKDKLNELQAKITASYASITSAGESGVLDASGGFENQYPFNFKRDQIRECVRQEMSRAKDTLTIISIRASFDDLLKDNVK